MRCTIHPMSSPDLALDVEECLVDALARELTRRLGGNHALNRLEAAAHLEQLLHAAPGAAACGPDRTPSMEKGIHATTTGPDHHVRRAAGEAPSRME